MQKVDLFAPRYNIAHSFPNSVFDDYFYIELTKDPITKKYIWESADKTVKYENDYFLKYPNIFKPLEWWQNRLIEDMPDYLATNYVEGKEMIYVKVIEHFKNGLGKRDLWNSPSTHFLLSDEDFHRVHSNVTWHEEIKYDNYSIYKPSTENKYLKYIGKFKNNQ